MDQFIAKMDGQCLTMSVAGRVDSSCSAEFGAKMKEAMASNPHETVCIDLDDLQYISSAGLREILRVRKQEPSLRIINVISEVYEIFDTTGFTEMLTIEKARRKVSIEGCDVIGAGANGTVYRLDPETIIKVYNNSDALSEIERERALARRAFVLGVPTAIAYDVVRVGNTFGAVFELLDSEPLAKMLQDHPENVDEYVNISVDLLRTIHDTEVSGDEIPDMKATAVDWARFLVPYLSDGKGEKLVSMMEAVPAVNRMMHGDYHIKNIMMQNGEALLIDMDTICQGHPIFEFGSIFNAYLGFYEFSKPDFRPFLGIQAKTAEYFWQKTIDLYFADRTEDERKAIVQKARLMGFVRLMRRKIRRNGLDTEEGRAEIEFYKNAIEEAVDQLDSIAF